MIASHHIISYVKFIVPPLHYVKTMGALLRGA